MYVNVGDMIHDVIKPTESDKRRKAVKGNGNKYSYFISSKKLTELTGIKA